MNPEGQKGHRRETLCFSVESRLPFNFSASLFSLCASVDLRFVEQEEAETAEDSDAENRQRVILLILRSLAAAL